VVAVFSLAKTPCFYEKREMAAAGEWQLHISYKNLREAALVVGTILRQTCCQ